MINLEKLRERNSLHSNISESGVFCTNMCSEKQKLPRIFYSLKKA